MKRNRCLDNTPNQPSKYRTKNWAKINVDARGRYNVNSKIRLKAKMLKLRLCNFSDAYMLVKGIITIADTLATAVAANNANEKSNI